MSLLKMLRTDSAVAGTVAIPGFITVFIHP